MSSSTTSSGYKIDPATLSKLQSRGENYGDWFRTWQWTFRYAGLWPYVDGTATADDEKLETQAMVMILSAVRSDLMSIMTPTDSASRAWAALRGRFDRDIGTPPYSCFVQLSTYATRKVKIYVPTWMNFIDRGSGWKTDASIPSASSPNP